MKKERKIRLRHKMNEKKVRWPIQPEAKFNVPPEAFQEFRPASSMWREMALLSSLCVCERDYIMNFVLHPLLWKRDVVWERDFIMNFVLSTPFKEIWLYCVCVGKREIISLILSYILLVKRDSFIIIVVCVGVRERLFD